LFPSRYRFEHGRVHRFFTLDLESRLKQRGIHVEEIPEVWKVADEIPEVEIRILGRWRIMIETSSIVAVVAIRATGTFAIVLVLVGVGSTRMAASVVVVSIVIVSVCVCIVVIVIVPSIC
jgi:hypothetical protein